jgi:hypothetical protein
MNGAFHAPPLTARLSLLMSNQGGKALKWLPAHFNFETLQNQKESGQAL